jgi:hypothetical protein
MKDLEYEDIIDRAERWARFHSKPNLRNRMDECLEGITDADQRRVYLCGQRIAAGLKAKVADFTPPKEERKTDGKQKSDPKRKRRSAGGAKPSDPPAKNGNAVGSGLRDKRPRKKG